MRSKDAKRRFSFKPTPTQSIAIETRPSETRTKSADLSHRSAIVGTSARGLAKIRENSQSLDTGLIKRNSTRTHDGTQVEREQISNNSSLEITSQLGDRSKPSWQTQCREQGSRAASAMSLPLHVPDRKSSIGALRGPDSRRSSIYQVPPQLLDGPVDPSSVVPGYGLSNSPVRKVSDRDPVSFETLRRSPAKTIVRTSPPLDVLDVPSCRHDRVGLTTDISAPLFVGGGTLEGKVHLDVACEQQRNPKESALSISRLCVDVIGVEEISNGRRWVFLSLASELIDKEHPPPFSLVVTQSAVSHENSWPLKSSSTDLPFCLNLPLHLGPPPYVSKQAQIRYVLAVTALVCGYGKSNIIRRSRDIQLLTVYDPEKALASLPSPLLASDSLSFSGQSRPSVKLTAGLHRQTWVNGSHIFVDVHVLNQTTKVVKRVEVQLEKRTLWYSYAAAGTAEKSASHLRLPKRIDTEIVATTLLKKCKAWKGIATNSSQVRTLALEVPHGHVTISTGRFFEVRYFLNVVVNLSMFKNLTVQLPVTLIHLNSLDIVPNSVAQVAAAIEAKRARCLPLPDEVSQYPPYHQGQAFTAPRRQSLEQMRKSYQNDELVDTLRPTEIGTLTEELDNSPRKSTMHSRDNGQSSHPHGAARSIQSSSTNGRRTGFSENAPPQSPRLGQSRRKQSRETSPTNQRHRRSRSSASSMAVAHPKIPRLQLSTSGLGFTDSEFSFERESPPRKVMLSESERRSLHQQQELRLAQHRSSQSQAREHVEVVTKSKPNGQGTSGTHRFRPQVKSDHNGRGSHRASAPAAWKWKNVADSADLRASYPSSLGRGSGSRLANQFPTNKVERPVRQQQSLDADKMNVRRTKDKHGKYPRNRVSFEKW